MLCCCCLLLYCCLYSIVYCYLLFSGNTWQTIRTYIIEGASQLVSVLNVHYTNCSIIFVPFCTLEETGESDGKKWAIVVLNVETWCVIDWIEKQFLIDAWPVSYFLIEFEVSQMSYLTNRVLRNCYLTSVTLSLSLYHNHCGKVLSIAVPVV